jgi:hypothetical protein
MHSRQKKRFKKEKEIAGSHCLHQFLQVALSILGLFFTVAK